MVVFTPMPEMKIFEGIHKAGMSDQNIAKEILIGTLTHELGHNFGLRHNFRGSMDKDNFWGNHPGEEDMLDSEGNAELQSASVMDYEHNVGHELNRPGRYDEETIKVGYSSDPLPETVVFPFEFCTDENSSRNGGVDAYCLIFDRGTSAKEITESIATRFHQWYKVYNLPIEGYKRFDTRQSIMGYISRIVFSYMIPMRRFADYRQYRYWELYYELDKDEEAVKVHPEIQDLNEGVINSFHFLASALYNDKPDLDTIDQYTNEVLVRGIIYDRIYSSMFLSMESLGSWGYNFTSVTTYPSLFDNKYFKDRGFTEERFFEVLAQAPSGWFNKYSYADKGAGFIEGSGSNMMRPEIRTWVIDDLLYYMNTLGSKAKYHAVITAKNINDETSQLAEFEESTLNGFLDKLSSDNGNGMSNKDFYLSNLAKLKELLQDFAMSLPSDPGGDLSEELEDLYTEGAAINNEIAIELARLGNLDDADTLLGAISTIDGPRTSEIMTDIADIAYRVRDTVFNVYTILIRYEKLIPKSYLLIKNSRFEIDGNGNIAIDAEGQPLPSSSKQLYDSYFANNPVLGTMPINAIISSAFDVSSEFEKVSLSLTAGLFEDDDFTRIYDPSSRRIIIAPKNSSITNLVAERHKVFVGQQNTFTLIKNLLNSADPMEARFGNALMQGYGFEDVAELDNLIDVYDWFINMERDMLYEMFELYIKHVPGHTWY